MPHPVHGPRCYVLLLYSLFLLLDKKVHADPSRVVIEGPSLIALKYRDGVIVAANARSPAYYQPHRWPDAIRPVTDQVLLAATESALHQATRLQQQLADDMAPRRSVRQLAHALRALQSSGDEHRGELLLVGLAEDGTVQMYILHHGVLLEERGPWAVAGREAARLLGRLDGCPDNLEEAAAVERCRRALQSISQGPILLYLVSRHRPLRHCILRPIMSQKNEKVEPSAG